MRGRTILSVDLGQSVDPTAVSILRCLTRHEIVQEQYDDPPGPPPPKEWFPDGSGPAWPGRVGRIEVVHLERLPLKMAYPDQIAHVQKLLRRPPLTLATDLVLDGTGVGRPIVDQFRDSGLQPIAVTITAGDSESRGEKYNEFRVAKSLLVSRLQSLLHAGELKIAKGLKEAEVLTWELQDFRASVSDTGVWRFGARSGKHDDLVLAVALGCWWACRPGETMQIGTFLI